MTMENENERICACRYVDYPITDVLQMIGRAGRPQFDDKATAVILVHEPKKGFYKKFLYEPFPVESALHEQVVDHLNAEVVGGTVKSAQHAVDYLTWTYLYCRLAQNPSYYGMEGSSAKDVADYLSVLVEDSFVALQVCRSFLTALWLDAKLILVLWSGFQLYVSSSFVRYWSHAFQTLGVLCRKPDASRCTRTAQ